MKILLVAVGITITMSFLSWSGLGSFADADNDGITDSIDNCPNIANSIQSDFDGDKIGDECDLDDDNDGVIDEKDAFDYDPTEWADFDSDGIGDNADIDDDNDNIVDAIDAFDYDPTEWADFDFDGIGANEDTDDDNDGILDVNDSTPIPVSQKLTERYLTDIQTCAIMDNETPKLLCFSQLFYDLVIEDETTVDTLELALTLTKLGAIGDCHFVSHEIGQAGFEKNSNVYENLRGIDGSICRGGFYHGTMASYFHDLRENGEDISSYKTICNDFIGSPDYTKCVHGLGHGLVHYYSDDLNGAINACDQMSFYQGSICVGGVFMQYTDNELTRSTSIEEAVKNTCTGLELRIFDYQQCSDNLGLTIAFHTNHSLEKGSELCDLISNDVGRQYCHRGLEREINDAMEYKVYDPTKGVRELVQPIWIKENDSNKWIVDFRSPARISDFVYDEETKMMQFSFDNPYRIIIYIATDLLPENPIVTVNGQIQNDLEIKHGLYDNHSMIKILPDKSGTVLIN
ncbi:MAG: thrombospondin type 3 repeat-containing protein [Thaumarchaeota archaeon]|nr:thrombospondin type 3 repeat-containing protein [Nitrososphaerota archaeon]